MFDKQEVLDELDTRLRAAGLDPQSPNVQTICAIVNEFYAEKTREVLEMVQRTLERLEIN
jgi:hypothetical protein